MNNSAPPPPPPPGTPGTPGTPGEPGADPTVAPGQPGQPGADPTVAPGQPGAAGADPTVATPGAYWAQSDAAGGGTMPPGGGMTPMGQPPKKRPTGLIIGAVVVVLLLIGAAATAGFLLLGDDSDDDPKADESSETTSEEATDEETSDEPTDEETSDEPTDEETSEEPTDEETSTEAPPGQVLVQGTGYHMYLDDAWQEDTTTTPTGNVDVMWVLGGDTIPSSRANIVTERAFVGSATQEQVVEQVRTNLGSNGTLGDAPSRMLDGEEATGLTLTGTNSQGAEARQTTYVVVKDGYYYLVALNRAGDTGVADYEAALDSWTWE